MIAVIGGCEKTGKTTMALTFPKKLAYFEFDIGGYDRAIQRFSDKDKALIIREQYPTPLQALTLPGAKELIHAKLVVGMKEMWYKFLSDYNKACSNPEVKTVILDTWFQVWEMNRLSVLQEKQEAQLEENGTLKKGEKLRQSLLRVEYMEPNARMRNLMFYARGMGKNLVLVTYDRDEYKPQLDADGRVVEMRTGKKIYGGWGETMKHADIALWTSLDGNQPIATITLPGLVPLERVGFSLPDNSYSTLMKVASL